jgi:hypothetical protein
VQLTTGNMRMLAALRPSEVHTLSGSISEMRVS